MGSSRGWLVFQGGCHNLWWLLPSFSSLLAPPFLSSQLLKQDEIDFCYFKIELVTRNDIILTMKEI